MRFDEGGSRGVRQGWRRLTGPTIRQLRVISDNGGERILERQNRKRAWEQVVESSLSVSGLAITLRLRADAML